MRTTLIALSLVSLPAWAEGTAVAALLPPPVEALSSQAAPAAMIAVPVLKQAVQKGETIAADNIAMQQVPASQVFASTVTDAAILAGQQALRPLAAGTPLNKLHVRVAPVVSRNQAVTLVYRKGGVELTGRAQALEDGQVGQSIRVVNPATRTTLVGTIVDGATVEVN